MFRLTYLDIFSGHYWIALLYIFAHMKIKCIPVQKSRTNFRQFSPFDGIKIDTDRIRADNNGIKTDSPDKKQTVPDFFTPFANLKLTVPDRDPTGEGHAQEPGDSPGWQYLFSSLEEAGVQGRSPAYTSGFRYVAECPSCVQWMSDNGNTLDLSSSPLSARCTHAGGQGCQGNRGIPQPRTLGRGYAAKAP